MALGRRVSGKQIPMWVPYDRVAQGPGHPFYKKLNDLLKKDHFDGWVEELCEPYFRQGGRPSIPPGVYFRMLMVGYFEGLTSEREIAWRCADSLSLREFLGYDIHEATPDHSTLSVWRSRLGLKIYEAVFQRVLGMVAAHGLLGGETVGVDATTVEANAAMKSIVRKDSKENYREYVERLATEAGMENPSREERVRFDRKRKGKKLSNRDWQSKTDPEARIAKMKDGTTHLAYKAENAVDLDTSIVVAGRMTPADQGDTQTVRSTLKTAQSNLKGLSEDKQILEVVADKGYHEFQLVQDLTWEEGIATYIPEPNPKQRRCWHGDEKKCGAFHANRRRTRGPYGKHLGRKRATIVERAFAHLCETGALRRITLRGLENVQKRYLLHVVAYNLGVLMRAMFGYGTPRSAQGRIAFALYVLYALLLYAYLDQMTNSIDYHQ